MIVLSTNPSPALPLNGRVYCMPFTWLIIGAALPLPSTREGKWISWNGRKGMGYLSRSVIKMD